MKAAFTIVGVVIILILFGTMMAGIKNAQTDERIDAFAAVTTGVGVTEADVVLVTDIYDNSILNVSGIVSSNALDAPLPDSFTPVSNTLTIRGLNANDTRSLEVVYLYAALTGDAAPAGTFLGMVPIFVGIAIVVIIVGAGIAVWTSRRG